MAKHGLFENVRLSAGMFSEEMSGDGLTDGVYRKNLSVLVL
jgi:hypothetical protein